MVFSNASETCSNWPPIAKFRRSSWSRMGDFAWSKRKSAVRTCDVLGGRGILGWRGDVGLSFKVAARAILELGAELISSDSVAIYELVKNAIDARSPDGVVINLTIVLAHSDYVDALATIDNLIEASDGRDGPVAAAEVSGLRDTIIASLLPSAPEPRRTAFVRALEKGTTLEALKEALRSAYAENNWIEFRDSGEGMSLDDLRLT